MSTGSGRRDPVLVAGAGAQGLTFALSLARRGVPVIVAEGAPGVGGQARSFRYGGYTFDFGLHAFVSRDPRVLAFARSTLGGDLLSFRPRAATRLANGAFVADGAEWRLGTSWRRFYELLPAGDDGGGWNCMAVSEPPLMLYPRRGFGQLCESMAKELVARGGRLLLGVRLSPEDLRAAGGRLTAVRLGGRLAPVSGCYWTAGTRALGGEGAPPSADDHLALYHFMARGKPSVPFHWVRPHDTGHPLLPRLVYFPARFSPRNAPAGAHGVGAVVPLPAERRWPPRARAVVRWCREKPADFTGLVGDYLARAGLLRADAVAGVRVEIMRLPGAAPRRAPALARLENLWLPERWKAEDPGESGVPLQMAAALRAADELLWAAPAPQRAGPSSRPSAKLRLA